MPKTQTEPRRNQRDTELDPNQAAAIHVAAVTGTEIPRASDLTDDAGLLARYEAAKAKEAARRKSNR